MTKENDFGFSMVTEIPTTEVPIPAGPVDTTRLDAIDTKLNTIIEVLSVEPQTGGTPLDAKLKQLEEIIVPLLQGLAVNPDAAYIKWPNRKPILDAKVQEVYRIIRA